MKKTPYILTLILLSLSIGLFFFLTKKPTGTITVSQKQDEDRYTFGASFPEVYTPKVKSYMDSCADLLRKDQLEFRIQTSSGELEITAEKSLNSPADIARIENMCRGIETVIHHN
jgi:hypothetical protein